MEGTLPKSLLRGMGWVRIKCCALAELEETIGEEKTAREAAFKFNVSLLHRELQ